MSKKNKPLKILAIETSCDDTGIALLECSGGIKKPQFKILKNLVSSQVAVHQPFHGVVPNLAKREHIKHLPLLLKKLKVKGSKLKVNAVAVTVGPGLEPALWTGINFAEVLAKELKKPLVGVNHMEGHVYSNWLDKKNKIKFPAIVLIVSGGHTILLKMDSIIKWVKLGETLDDAAGEAFDKVARMLGLKYPGGPEIAKLALSLPKGSIPSIKFPRPMLNKPNYQFSFSGLKTSVLYFLRDNPKAKKADVAASFQQAVIDVLVGKTMRAAKEFKAKSVLLCGGVAANRALRAELKVNSEKLGVSFFAPAMDFNTDNAVMIGAAAYVNILAKNKKLPIEANGSLDI